MVGEGRDGSVTVQPAQTWAADLYCPTCGTVTVEVPVGTGIAAFLESRPPCPGCGTAGLWMTKMVERPRPPEVGSVGVVNME
jgi:predicted RNA-binding Zn-ribbon protein involved in translation (DUF1610 family)